MFVNTFFFFFSDLEGFPYYSRPGIVLDDPEFKPHIGGQRRPIQVQVPSKGDVFDIMVSAIQGPGDKPGLLSRKCQLVYCTIYITPLPLSHTREVTYSYPQPLHHTVYLTPHFIISHTRSYILPCGCN